MGRPMILSEVQSLEQVRKDVENDSFSKWLWLFVLLGLAVGTGVLEGVAAICRQAIEKPTWVIFIAASGLALALGEFWFRCREIVRRKWYPMFEMGVGAATASYSLRTGQPELLGTILAFIAGVLIIVDGRSRLWRTHQAKKIGIGYASPPVASARNLYKRSVQFVL